MVYGSSASKALNDATIQVTCSAYGKTSDPYTVNLTVQQPTKLVITGTDTTSAEAKCPANNPTGCGVTRTFTYQVYDQLSPANPIQASLDHFDGISAVLGSNGCNLGSYQTTCATNASCDSNPAERKFFRKFADLRSGMHLCWEVHRPMC